MIRELKSNDISRVAEIWLQANLSAHDFISPDYWKDNRQAVSAALQEAEVYVYEAAGKIQGFVGLNGDYIEGIFVSEESRSSGIGRSLLDFVKSVKEELSLHVYQKNRRAIEFYTREGFQILESGADEYTQEADFLMGWRPLR